MAYTIQEAKEDTAYSELFDLIYDGTKEHEKISCLKRHGIISQDEIEQEPFPHSETKLTEMILENDIKFEDVF